MKVAITSTQDPRSSRTWSGTTLNLIRALEKEGIEVYTIAVGPNTKVGILAFRALAIAGGAEMVYSFPYKQYAGRRVAKALRGMEVDAVIHTGNTAFMPAASLDIPQYLYCDSTWYGRITRNPFIHPLIRMRSREQRHIDESERTALSRLEHIFAISECVRNDIVSHYGIPQKRVTVVGTGLGVAQDDHKVEKDYSSGQILFVAKHAFIQKGGLLLAQGFHLALRATPNLSLVIVGDKEARRYTAGIPNIRITGFITNDELKQCFQNASLYAMPAIYEPWGLVYLEALANGIPILGLRRNALPEIAGDGRYGFLVDNDTPEAIAEAIINAFSDHSRLRSMGNAGKERTLSSFTWQKVARAIISRIESFS